MMCVRTAQHCLGLLAAAGLVHGTIGTAAVLSGAKAATPQAQRLGTTNGARGIQSAAADTLPAAVADMRDAILEAVRSGRLEDLKIAMDLNELKPELAAQPVGDPIAFWQRISSEGHGRDVLAVLDALFDMPFSIQPLGKDPENTRLFVWPAFADRPMAALTSEEEAQLSRIETADKIQAMKLQGKYVGWRLIIGADGVWHAFRRYD